MIPQPLSLSELTVKIQGVFDEAFINQIYWVFADVSNHSFQHNKGFHYFDLVEKESKNNSLKAKLSASAWGLGSDKILFFEKETGQKFRNDIRILALVSVDYHPVYGLKLNLLDLDIHFTLGALEMERQKTIMRLLTECSDFVKKVGDKYITRNKELALPLVIQSIAVISSKNSAGFEDFEHTLLNNAFGYQFKMDTYFTLVQGEGNGEAIRNILIDIFKGAQKYDVVLILRGGGATTDFLIFETFMLGRVVAKYPIPIITGIGHQKNETIVDLMAHTATKTPTQVAEFILAYNQKFESRMILLRQKIIIRSQSLLAQSLVRINDIHSRVVNYTRTHLYNLNHNLQQNRYLLIYQTKKFIKSENHLIQNLTYKVTSQAKYLLNRHQTELLGFSNQIKLSSAKFLNSKKIYLNHFQDMIRVMNPRNILKKGFAILTKDQKVLINAKSLKAGTDFQIELYDEKLTVTLIEKQLYGRNEL